MINAKLLMTRFLKITISLSALILSLSCAKKAEVTRTAEHSNWNPAELCAYLSDKLPTGPYQAAGPDFSCGSLPKAVGPTPGSTVAYYVKGDAQRAREMGLVFKVDRPQTTNELNKIFMNYCQELQTKALGAPLSGGATNAIVAGHAGKGKVGGTKVEVKRTETAGGGYELQYAMYAP